MDENINVRLGGKMERNLVIFFTIISVVKYHALFVTTAFSVLLRHQIVSTALINSNSAELEVAFAALWILLFVLIGLLELYPLIRMTMGMQLQLTQLTIFFWVTAYFLGNILFFTIDFIMEPCWEFVVGMLSLQFSTAAFLGILVLLDVKRRRGETVEEFNGLEMIST